MGEPLYINLLFIFILLFSSAFFSGAEASFFSLRRLSSPLKNENRIIKFLLADPQRLLVTVFTGNDIANATLSAAVTGIALKLQIPNGKLIAAITSILLVLIFAEILPRKIAFHKSELYSQLAAPVLYVFSFITYPAYLITTKISHLILKLLPASKISAALTEEEIEILLKEDLAGKEFDIEEIIILSRIFKLDRLRCADIMRPRNEIIMLEINTDGKEIISKIKESEQKFFPVYEKEEDNIAGYVSLKDIIAGSEKNFSLRNILKSPYYVPELKKVIKLLKDFRDTGDSLFIVVDEFGTYTGIITIKDLIKTILGRLSKLQKKIIETDNELIVSGDTKIEDLREYSINLPHEDYETLSGFILNELGRIPTKGENILYGDHKFVVESVDKKRTIKKIIIRKISKDV